MAYYTLQFNNFNEDNNYNHYFFTLKDNTYSFIVRWSYYCNCAFLRILDENDNELIGSVALINGLKIRNKNLPYELYFVQINGETYEPTINNISSEFVLFYDDEVEIQ